MIVNVAMYSSRFPMTGKSKNMVRVFEDLQRNLRRLLGAYRPCGLLYVIIDRGITCTLPL